MAKMHIERAISIDASPEKVFNVISNFKEWVPWSPWLLMEPECELSYAEDGKSYDWKGNRIGSGGMTILDSEENKWINYDLVFLTPWKSESKVRFELKEEGGQTHLTWLMDGKLPFFLFFMKKSMEAYVGADYERGLDMLKVYVETGEVPSKLEFKGESNYAGSTYVGVKTNTGIEVIDKSMESDFTKLKEFIDQNPDNIDGAPFSIYHKWDLVKNKVHYTAAIPVKEVPDSLPTGCFSSSIPATKVHTIRHVGPYQHVGNAWSTAMSMMRNKEFKAVKGIHPFEIYQNDPATTDSKELISDITFAIR